MKCNYCGEEIKKCLECGNMFVLGDYIFCHESFTDEHYHEECYDPPVIAEVIE